MLDLKEDKTVLNLKANKSVPDAFKAKSSCISDSSTATNLMLALYYVVDGHTYTKRSGLIGGYANEIAGEHSSVTCGIKNRTSGLASSVTGIGMTCDAACTICPASSGGYMCSAVVLCFIFKK